MVGGGGERRERERERSMTVAMKKLAQTYKTLTKTPIHAVISMMSASTFFGLITLCTAS